MEADVTMSVAEIAAFLGLSPSRVRHIIAAHRIAPRGARWKAKMYDPVEVVRHAGVHDRACV